jgi:hypothetical protein
LTGYGHPYIRLDPKWSADDEVMTKVTIYGLTDEGLVASSEELSLELTEARAAAEARLARWAAVEVWSGPVCLCRLRRPQG